MMMCAPQQHRAGFPASGRPPSRAAAGRHEVRPSAANRVDAVERRPSEREAIARTSISGLARIAGSTRSSPIFAVLRTPHTTFFMRSPERRVIAAARKNEVRTSSRSL